MRQSTSTPPVRRVFLGWDVPALVCVRDYLVPDASEGPVDLRSTLVVVPTRHAGRRLREALAVLCHEKGTYLLPPRIVTPPSLIAGQQSDATRDSLDVAATWTRLLLEIDPINYPGLFPKQPTRTVSWALATGKLLDSLRTELMEHGLTIRRVIDVSGDELDELQRWEDMAHLEDLYIARYHTVTGRQEPGIANLQAAADQQVPEGIDRIIVACVADPTPIALQALASLAPAVATTVLIHAPEDYADVFDAWGRPLPDHWRQESIDIPDPAGTLMLAGSPGTESQFALGRIKAHGGATAVGVLDPDVGPYLEADLENAGLAAFDPNGVPVSTTPLLHLLRAYRGLTGNGAYKDLATFLRNADILDHLAASSGLHANDLLRELDEYQNHYLPATAGDILTRFRDNALTDDLPAERLTNLRSGIKQVATMVQGEQGEPIQARIRRFLQTVFAHRELEYGSPDDDAFRSTAVLVDEALQASAESSLQALGFADGETLDVLLDQLGSARFTPQRPRNAIDLEGWLELQWNDASHIVVAGMNEGKIPARLGNETFLPETLRVALGLRTNDDRYGRDVYLARSLIESRRSNGSIIFIAAKATAGGDPLMPSRILFRCRDEELPDRASRLFGPPDDRRVSIPSSISFRFKADAPLRLRPPAVTRVSVVGLRDYIACPFRFYLKHVLRMNALDDRKRELDALDFGSLVHHVMNSMAADETVRDSDDARVVRQYLAMKAEEWVDERLGSSLPLNISIQLADARERLGAAARVHAEAVAAGWRIVGHEESFEQPLGGLTLRGRIDRIDRHIETGEIRVLDYKASENGKDPDKAHLSTWRDSAPAFTVCEASGKNRRWVDLQLPLYALMLPERFRDGGPISAGYFNLPADADATAIIGWEGFGDDLSASAHDCAEAAARSICAGIFWPPAEKVDFDDFEAIFPGGISEDTIDPGCLEVSGEEAG